MSKGADAPDEKTLKKMAKMDQGAELILEEYNDTKLRQMDEARYIENW